MAQGNKPSEMPATYVGVALIATVLAGFAGVSSTGGSRGTAAPEDNVRAPVQVEKAGAGLVEANDPRRPFQEFRGFLGNNDQSTGQLIEELTRLGDALNPSFLIATVPDPIDSRFGYRFDSLVDDLQMAVESQGWYLDRFWLPWWPQGTQPTLRSQIQPVFESPPSTKAFSIRLLDLKGLTFAGGAYGGPLEEATSSGSAALHERHPGVLLFRGKPQGSEKPQILVVFLVGERPISGVHKAVLSQALQVVQGVSEKLLLVNLATVSGGAALQVVQGVSEKLCGASPRRVFDIVGPYFSGSERSVVAVIDHWEKGPAGHSVRNRESGWKFKFRTGSANHLDSDWLQGYVGPDKPEIVFDSTVHDFELLLTALFNFLKERNGGWSLGKVALLTESDTEFASANNEGLNKALEKIAGTQITEMKYPFHVSQLAAARDRTRTADRKANPSLAPTSSRLSIPFDETGSPRDAVPSLSPAMTAASDEFDLAKILETISTEGYRYVGIVASDTRDIIFLTGLINEFCPDVQVFTTASDLLLGHPEYTDQLRGTIVASTYPLFSMAQRWDPPHQGDRRRHLFMHDADQGYFNAAVSLLGEASGKPLEAYFGSLYDYGEPFDEMEYAESERRCRHAKGQGLRCESCRHKYSPYIWLSVIGERGLWPVMFLPPSSPEGESRPIAGSEAIADDLRIRLFDPALKEPPDKVGDGKRTNDGESDDTQAQKLLSLIPHLSWIWGTATLLLAGMLACLYWAQWRLALASNRPVGIGDLIRRLPNKPGGDTSRLWSSQEWFVAMTFTILALAITYSSIYPCRLILRHSPWRWFLVRMLRGESPLSWGDYWNWQFGLVAMVACAAAVVALASAIAVRAHAGFREGGGHWPVLIPLAIAAAALLLGIVFDPIWLTAARSRGGDAGDSWDILVVIIRLLEVAAVGYGTWKVISEVRHADRLVEEIRKEVEKDTHSETIPRLKKDYYRALDNAVYAAPFLTLIAALFLESATLAYRHTVSSPTYLGILGLGTFLGFLLGAAVLSYHLGRAEDGESGRSEGRRRWMRPARVLFAVFAAGIVLSLWFLDLPSWRAVAVRAADAGILGLSTWLVIRSYDRAQTLATRLQKSEASARRADAPSAQRRFVSTWLAIPSYDRAQTLATRIQKSEASARRADAPSAQRRFVRFGRSRDLRRRLLRRVLRTPVLGPFIEKVVRSASDPERTKMHSVKDRRSQKLRHRTFWTVLGIPALGGLLMVVAEASLTTPAGPYDPLLFLERAMNLSNGVTPLVPALLLGLVGLGWVVTQLRRVDYVDRFWRDRVADPKLRPMDQKADDQPELQSAKKRKDRMAEAAQGVRKLLFSPIPGLMLKNLGSLAALLLTSLTAIRLAERAIPGVDGASFTRWMFLAFGLSAFLVVISLCRFLLVWGAIRHVLREVSLAPMQRAFERLPRTITREFGPYLNAIRPGLRNLEVHIRQWARVASGFQPAEAAKRVFGEGNGDVGGCMSELAGVIRGDDLDKLFDVGTTDPAERIIRAFEVECVDPEASVRLAASQVRTAMRRAAGACMTVMIPLWKDRSLDEAYGSAPVEQKAGSGATRTGATGTASEPPPGAESNPWKDWLGQAEELIALEFVQFITESSVHLKNLAQFLTFAPILILLAACSYPFQPSRFLITALWGLLVAVAVGVVFVHVQMERNELLSRVSKTSPDSISFNWTFMSQVAAILIPLLGVVLAQFPFVSDALNQLLGPLSRVLR